MLFIHPSKLRTGFPLERTFILSYKQSDSLAGGRLEVNHYHYREHIEYFKNKYIYSDWSFKFEGNKIGFDCTGKGSADFVSNSGRVIISKNDWYICQSQSIIKTFLIKASDTIVWKVIPLFVDKYAALLAKDATREYPTIIIQGIPNHKHILQIKTRNKKPVPVKEIRFYRPSIKSTLK